MLKSTGLQRVGHNLVTEQQQNMRLTLKFFKNELLGIFTLEDTCLLGKCDLRVIICPLFYLFYSIVQFYSLFVP